MRDISRKEPKRCQFRTTQERGFFHISSNSFHLFSRRIFGTHPAFTYGTLLNRCGIKTSTNSRAPNDGTRHCIFSSAEVIFSALLFGLLITRTYAVVLQLLPPFCCVLLFGSAWATE